MIDHLNNSWLPVLRKSSRNTSEESVTPVLASILRLYIQERHMSNCLNLSCLSTEGYIWACMMESAEANDCNNSSLDLDPFPLFPSRNCRRVIATCATGMQPLGSKEGGLSHKEDYLWDASFNATEMSTRRGPISAKFPMARSSNTHTYLLLRELPAKPRFGMYDLQTWCHILCPLESGQVLVASSYMGLVMMSIWIDVLLVENHEKR